MLRRRLAWSLVVLLALALGAGGLGERSVLARPGGGQSFRSSGGSRSSSSGSRSYSTPSRSSSSYSGSSSSSSSGRSNYSSSSSSSSTVYVGTSSGRSSDGGSLFSLLIILLIVAFIIWFFWLRKKKPERATLAVDKNLQQAGLLALQKQDASFDPAAFTARTRTVVAKVNEAWCKGNMGPSRRVISDGVYVRFQTQIGLLKAGGLRNAMADWRVVSADIMGAQADAMWDTVHVKIVGEARDADVALSLSEADAQKKVKSAPLSQYHEVWSFVRRRGKSSKNGVPALEGKCPSCGAELPLSEVVKCEYCQAVVNSGEHDWVLAEITQPEEWRADPAVGELPGLEELRARDASVSRQELEDRGSVIFWKWIEARTSGKNTKLLRFCLEPPTDAATASVLALEHTKLSQVAVGSAELLGIDSDDTYDHAVIEVVWSASVGGKEPTPFKHALTLARSISIVSKRGLSSLDCPVCGGQLANSDDVNCSYCGTELSGGKHEWALESVTAEDVDGDSEE